MIFQGGGGRTPYPPSGSAHAISQLIFLISKGNISCGFSKDPSQEDDSFEHQNKCLDLKIRKYSQFYAEKKCLSGPMLCNVTGPENWILTSAIKAL